MLGIPNTSADCTGRRLRTLENLAALGRPRWCKPTGSFARLPQLGGSSAPQRTVLGPFSSGPVDRKPLESLEGTLNLIHPYITLYVSGSP